VELSCCSPMPPSSPSARVRPPDSPLAANTGCGSLPAAGCWHQQGTHIHVRCKSGLLFYHEPEKESTEGFDFEFSPREVGSLTIREVRPLQGRKPVTAPAHARRIRALRTHRKLPRATPLPRPWPGLVSVLAGIRPVLCSSRHGLKGGVRPAVTRRRIRETNPFGKNHEVRSLRALVSISTFATHQVNTVSWVF
jgi:hypothetical protein